MTDTTRIRVRVQPRASDNRVAGYIDGVWQMRVTAPPVDGEANEAVIGLLAKSLGVRRSAIGIDRGAAGRSKTVIVEGLSAGEVARLLEAAARSSGRKR